jgi:hypothetical protein
MYEDILRTINVIISISAGHPAAKQLDDLAQKVRAAVRGETPDTEYLSKAINLVETKHAGRTASYHFLPGGSSSKEALSAYNHLRSHYPHVLEVLHMSASKGATELTVEVGSLGREDHITYSHHDMIKIMPMLLAIFRGRVQ